MSAFQPATRASVPVKVALVGPSGSGKTYTALRIARGIAGEQGRIALIDTEHGSASLYADEFQFDTNVMPPPYKPALFASGILAAAAEGYDVLVIDGISPAWNGPGGVMEIVDQNAKGGNSWSGWAKGTPAHNQLVQGILAAPLHLICTMRSKTEWVLGDKNKPEKVGLAPVQRDGMDYEFSVVGELDLEHRMHVTKSRLRGIEVGDFVAKPDEDLGRLLVAASQGSPRSNTVSVGAAAQQPSPGGSAAPSGDDTLTLPPDGAITADQVKRLWTIARKELKLTDAAVKAVVVGVTGQESTKAIPNGLYDKVIEELKTTAKAVPK